MTTYASDYRQVEWTGGPPIGSYAYNYQGSGGPLSAPLGLGGWVAPSRMDAEVVSPSQMIAFGDAQGGNSYFVPANPQVSSHGEKYNILFCDGHVEFIERHRLFDAKDAASRRRWNYDNEPHSN